MSDQIEAEMSRWSKMNWLEQVLQTVVGIVDGRAIDLNYRLIVERTQLLTVIASLALTSAASALFSNPMDAPTPEHMFRVLNAVSNAREFYAQEGAPLADRSLWIVEEAERVLALTGGNSSSSILLDETENDYFESRYSELGGSIYDSMNHFLNGIIFSVLTYVSVVFVQRSETRHFFNLFYYLHLGGILVTIISLTIGSSHLGMFIQTRIMFTYPTALTMYRILRYNDIWASQAFSASNVATTPADNNFKIGRLQILMVLISFPALFVNCLETFYRIKEARSQSPETGAISPKRDSRLTI
ncbi:Hypothetical Protein FCC1311_010392 [Hondaea fermentalgiana]|uniref:Uncharacterized protein n=1 Tax=Hondaea fermentalgiana TaxID=2315210 RepID=A0A2R5G9S7_9STRA|nr:Hypothetical Protein FCC1311_010392 [Hondaea fermentalgiana]|eukprot:GBG24821.1 Hypothetical Protein FCC1311_010392 [Hondaea fermentalgiana]